MDILNKIKKVIYTEKPIASLMHIRKGQAVYSAFIKGVGNLHFHVPVSDMGDAIFHVEMDGKLLIRWYNYEPMTLTSEFLNS